jgi:putative nucleotidyltransferase with HDIG domain
MKKINGWFGRKVSFLKTKDVLFLMAFYLLSVVVMAMTGQIDLLVKRNDLFMLKEGDFALKDFYVDRDISFIDKESTDRRIRMKESLVHPVFVRQHATTKAVFQEYQTFIGLLASLMETHEDKELVLEEIELQFPGIMTMKELNHLSEHENFTRVTSITGEILGLVMDQGIVSFPSDSDIGASGIIDIMDLSGDINERTPWLIDRVLTKKNIGSYIRKSLESRALTATDRNLIIMLVEFFYRENCYYSHQRTETVRKETLSQVEPVVITLKRGDKIIAKGSMVTGSDRQIISALQEKQNKTGFRFFGETMVFLLIILVVTVIVFAVFKVPLKRKQTYLLFSLTLAFELLMLFILGLLELPRGFLFCYVVPVSLWGILVAQLTSDKRIGFFMICVYSLMVMFLTDRNALTMLFSLLTGMAGVLSVNQSARRIDMVRGGAILAVVHMAVVMLINLYAPVTLGVLAWSVLAAALNGFFSGILSLAILPLFEHFLNFCTTFRLMELSDHNTPVMKRMLSLAPGTYVHSLNVANLAESASQRIGANSLMARIGAFYHDIGKIDQPEYFIENQTEENKHDEMKASLSAAVIKSHVKIGAEKGRELRLPEEIIDIINQHHGTSMIYYFYDRAIKDGTAGKINEDDYRHSGPRPATREAAIVMLSDVVEAATRTLKKPTPAKLEKVIWDLIMERFRLGELNDCDLTLRDLEVIKDTFVQVLTGHFHKRIEYPQQKGKSGEQQH